MARTTGRSKRTRTTRVRSRAEAKHATREALVAAAMELISARGLDAPSLDEICERAGYTRGAFYVHFADRDDLLRAVMEGVGRRVLDALLGASDADLGDVAARFVAALASGAYPLTREGGVRPYQLLDACARSPAIRAQYVQLVEESVARLAAIVKRAKLAAGVAPRDTSVLLVSLIVGTQTLLDVGFEVDVGAAADATLKLLGAKRRARR